MPPKHGWGSFMTEQSDQSVESLISQSEDEYTPPQLPVDISFKPYPVCGPPNRVTPGGKFQVAFGKDTKKALFYLDPNFTFVNHGAFGASLRPVVDVARRWQERMESQPLRFIDRELLPILVHVVREVAKNVQCSPTDVVLIPNATTGLNSIFRSISWEKGDRILCLDVGYGATKKMLSYLSEKHGVEVVELKVSFPVADEKEIVSLVRSFLRKSSRDNTIGNVKLAIFDWVNSNSALMLPVYALCELCKEYGIDTLVDGAHAWGSMSLDIPAIGCSYFTANAHKWLASAKGAALLYVAPHKQEGFIPAIMSHGHGGGSLLSEFIWSGLMDYGPWLSLLTAMSYWKTVGIASQSYIRRLLSEATTLLTTEWNSDLLAHSSLFNTMVCVRLPGPRVPSSGVEAVEIQNILYHHFKIEVTVKHLQNRLYVRISAYVYNCIEDYQKLASAVLEIRPRLEGEDDERDKEAAQHAALVEQEGGCG